MVSKPSLNAGMKRTNSNRNVQATGWALALGVMAMFGSDTALGQATPVAIPSAANLLAGGANSGGTGVSGKVLPTAGSPCFAGSLNTATDAFGDGCPGPYATFSTDFRGGVAADGEGNIYVIETTEGLIRKIDAKSGVITAVNSGGTGVCATALDGYGDGCPVANYKLNAARGGYIDPYGNVIIGGYSAQMINVICNAVSPLCPNTANHKQVGYVYRIAGCAASASAGGTASVGPTPGTAGDGLVASPNGNLSGDVTDWGAGNTAYTTTCGNSNGGVDQARGAIADKYGNVYIADTANLRYRVIVGPATFTLPNGTVLTNPLPAIIQLDSVYHTVTAAQMYGHIYPIFGAFASTNNGGYAIPTAKGTACVGAYASGGSTLDTVGDGCPFYESTGGTSTSSTIGVGLDSEGNLIIPDQNNSAVRVLYIAGAGMKAAIQAANANTTLTVTPGYIYPIIGLPGTAAGGLSYTPALGTTLKPNSNGSRLAVDPAGNLYFGDYGKNSVYMFDLNTGYARNVLVNGTACATAAPNNDSTGDGCSEPIFATTTPTTSNFSFGAGGGSALSITFDPHGNLIVADITNGLIRKITATDLVNAQVGTTQTQTLNIHNPAGTTGMTATLVTGSPDISIGAPTCNTANADTTMDCTIAATFAPLTPGKRANVLKVSAAGSNTNANFTLSGSAFGSALVTDIAAPAVAMLGTVTSAAGLAVDGTGKIVLTDSNNYVGIAQGSTTSAVISAGTAPSSVTQVAFDTSKNIYAVNGSATIAELAYGATGFSSQTVPYSLPAASYAATPAAFNSHAQISGIAIDPLGNIFIADQTNQAVFEIPAGTGFETLNQVVPVMTGFNAVGDLALDGQGNVFVADTGVGKVYRILASSTLYPTPTVTSASVVASNVVPTHIAADVAGDLYVQDASAQTIKEFPLSGASSIVYTFAATSSVPVYRPTGVAVDSNGVVYEAEATLTSINKVQRSAVAYTFPAAAATLPVTFANTGNMAATSFAQTNSAEFPVTTGSSNGCGSIASSALAVGTSCTATATFSPGNNGQVVTSKINLVLATATTGSLTLTGQEPSGTTYTTTTSVSGAASGAYAPTGTTELTFTVAESSTNSNSQNGETVNITITTNATSPQTVASTTCTLSGGACSVPVSGITVGSYIITATYPGDGTYLTSNGSANFSITEVTPTISWTPATSAVAYSQPVSTGALNATANVPGVSVYTANGAEIHAASYLAIGSYTLAGTFYPTDSVDYTTQTLPSQTFTVSQATTSANIGGTLNLVANDGTGNYTSVQTAVNALGATGGSVYIKPGTYGETSFANDTNGSITVVQPNVALRGLGGDPTAVILSHSGGAFGSSYPYTAGYTAAQSNSSQLPSGSSVFTGDEASATLVITRGINNGLNGVTANTTYTPNNFYAENLTINNVYDTDAQGTTTSYLSTAGNQTTCAVQTTAQTYSYLYNNNLLCASQALAVWTTGDTGIFNNVYMNSLQDTLYAGAISTGSTIPARQYYFRGKIAGDVDYIFGDAAAVFDHMSIYSAFHGNAATGTVTIHAQNKASQTGAGNDYVSGYVMNSDVFTSQAPGMSNLFFGRPYGTYSTYVMLNSYIDQVNPLGYTTGLISSSANSSFGEYMDNGYTDPTVGAPDMNGVLYNGVAGVAPAGGNSGSGVLPTSARESTSTDPGYPTFNANGSSNNVGMTPAQAQLFYPIAFLGQTTGLNSSYNTTGAFNPTTSLGNAANAFVPSTSPGTIVAGTSLTVLMRPQTPGLGAVGFGTYTIPTGTYALSDGGTVIASGNLDASGEAYYTSKTLAVGQHSFTWTFTSGDSNFASSSTSTPYKVTVSGQPTTTTVAVTATPIVYGQPASVTATVSGSGTMSGTVTLTIDGSATQTAAVSNGTASFTVTGLHAGTHSFAASYGGGGTSASSASTTNATVSVTQASLAVSGSCANRIFGAANSCSGSVTGGYQYSDSASTVIATLGGTTTALRNSPMGGYTASPAVTLTSYGSTNYTVSPAAGSFTISGGAAQIIVFQPLPNFAVGGTYQLTARASSGLPVSYAIDASSTGTATIVNGTGLQVTGAGTIVVNAMQSNDPTGDYAAATAVSRSFTAQ